MRSRSTFCILLGLLVLAGAWLFWPSAHRNAAQKPAVATPSSAYTRSASTAPLLFAAGKNATNTTATNTTAAKTNRFAWRLSNTSKTIGQLTGDPHAILLENALIDSSVQFNLPIPKNLQAQGDPGAYIVQARGPVDNAFRARLAAAGAGIVSYIPNNAYLVTISSGGAASLVGQPGVQSVIPYEPYYKLPESLMPWVGKTFPADRQLRVAAYPDTAEQLKTLLVNSGAQILSEESSSPFGKTFVIQNVTDLAALVQQRIVQRAEPAFRRVAANDLSRVTLGISDNTTTSTNYMDLSGKNVLVEVNDTGIDSTHPDFTANGTAALGPSGPTRVTGAFPSSLFDTNGHGTFVAGVIAGNGSKSLTPVSIGSVAQGSVTNADFRGKAPLASLYSVGFLDVNGNSFGISDSFLQGAPALTNALISNNSWNYIGDNTYNLAAASYDAAVRDALPLVTGSQPVLFVFAAGNDGGGNDNGGGGDSDTILSPGTSKNVITVGALEQLRNITNTYTPLDSTNQVAVWAGGTDSGTQVASYSGRGNVGIGSEGAYGRFKPDVVAPGSFVVSTRSQQWDEAAYYNPTNYYFQEKDGQVISARSVRNEGLSLNFSPPNVTFNSNIVAVQVFIFPNLASPSPFPDLRIYVSHINYPDPNIPASYDFVVTNTVSIPPDGRPSYLSQIQNGNLFMTILNTNSYAVPFDLVTEIVTTNQAGNYFQVYSNLNNTLGPPGGPWYYRYESGTSVAAPGVSGVLALMQDYFTNTLRTLPTPALLKAMLINGARPVGNYSYNITNDVNFEGWGLPGLPTTLPPGVTNKVSSPCTSFFLDQDSTNALATGDSRTFKITVDDTLFTYVLPLQVTLAWTDPPGNPAAAIKLVNNLDLVVTNLDTGEVYFGNDISPGTTFNFPWATNTAPNLDSVNNVENIIIPPLLGGSYSVTVIGTSVNVNAVTAQTNNVVQDFALVISSGNGEITNGLIVSAASPVVSHPTSDQQVTLVYVNANGMATNSTDGSGVFLNQLAGANTPLLGTNTVGAGSGYASNAIVTLGMTNQWHFYVVQNKTTFTNAAFVTFLPNTLSIPRMGVFANSDANATQPEADIDLYVSTDPSLTNLNPVVISNCVHGTQVGASLSGKFNGASQGGGGTEFIVDTNSQGDEIYYVAVKSETAEAAEYGFLPVFSQLPFSEMDGNGNETVRGLLLPVNIPDGTPKHPGKAYVFALAIQPIQVQNVIVSNQIVHQNFGDLVGTLNHSGPGVVLNNHVSLPPGIYNFIYNDGPVPVIGSQPPDGPGSLQNFQGQQGTGPWIFTQVDDSLTQTGAVSGFSLFITPHQDLTRGFPVSLQGGGFFYGFIDVPAGVTNLTIAATNTTPFPDSSPLTDLGQLFEKFGSQLLPAQVPPTNYDKFVTLSNFPPATPTTFPGGVINIGPSDAPPIQPGRYYVTLYNPSTAAQTFYVIATFAVGQAPPITFSSSGPTNLLDDAVSYSSLLVTNTQPIASVSVGLRVEHPRISDLVFHLISPDGTRFLLMENRGGTTTNGAGLTVVSANNFPPASSSGGPNPDTNIVNVGQSPGTVAIDYDFLSAPDEMAIFYQGAKIFDSGLINGSGTFNVSYGPGISTYLTIIMNEFTNSQPSTAWSYTIHSTQTNYYYLTLTQDTNLTTTPIKFAPPPFVPVLSSPVVWQNGFEGGSGSAVVPSGSYFASGWHVDSGTVDWLPTGYSGSTAYEGNYFIDLNGDNPGVISTNIPTMVGGNYVLSFAYARNPASIGDVDPIAQLKLNGSPALTLTVTNLDSWTDLQWATTSVVFTATSSSTALELDGLTASPSGVLLDAFVLKRFSSPGLYYLPEQSLDPLIGTSAYGLWQLEIQDDRAGATNRTILDSWQLSFIFANTNPVPAFTNSIPPGGLVWYQVDVPTNADFATNILTAATGPLNMWFSTNAPPTTNNAPSRDIQLLSGVTSGSVTLGTNGSPANVNPPAYMIPGGTYYIGIENPGGATVQYGFHVDFHFNVNGPFAFTQPATLVTGTSARLNGMATPNGAPATAWFEWGTSTLYGNSTPHVAVGAGFNVVYTNSVISGLAANVPYHFRLVVSNAQTAVYGFDQVLDQAYVVAWGANYVGQANVPSGLSNVVAIAGAFDHSLALKNDGTAVAWGDNTFGQATVPVGLSNLVAVAGGAYYSLVLKSNGTVASWGANILGQTNVPSGLNNVVTIAGGTYSSLALKNDGNVAAWGANFFSLTNVPANLSNAVAIAGGSYHSLAIKNDGTVVAWGDNSANQTNVPAGLTNVVAIAGGSYHSLALRYDGTVVAWGDNTAGQTNVPVGLSNVVAIAAGGFNSLALKADGSVVSWGDNTVGQNSVPAGLTNIVALASGYLHSLALTPQSIASLTNVVLNLTNGVAQTNTISPGGVTYYRVSVPSNADFATNSLSTLNASQTLNLWFSTTAPNLTTLLLGGVTNGTSILSSTSAPPNIVPGSFYYLGVQNTNSFPVAYGIGVNFHLVTSTNPPPLLTNTLSIIHTSIGGTNGFLLTWFAPSNALFQVEWTTGFAPPTWLAFTNIVGYNTNVFTSPTSTQFNFFDDASQTGGVFGPTRFYRLKQVGTVPPAFTVPISSILFTNGNFRLTWFAPTNSQFNVRSATNLVPPISWTIFPGGPITSTTGTFTFTDTNAPLFMKFYQLLLFP